MKIKPAGSAQQFHHIAILNSMHLKYLILCTLPLWACTSFAQVELVTAEESSRPNLQNSRTRAISRGPAIQLLSMPNVEAKSFPFKISMEPRGGAQLDKKSIKIEYLKIPTVEITDRVRSAFSGNQIDITNASVPRGSHSFKISVKDVDGREAQSIITLEAK